VEASGGEMNGCIGGRWVMGVPYTQNASVTLPPTTTYGVYESKLYDKIEPVKVDLNATVTTAAEVRRPHSSSDSLPLQLNASSPTLSLRCASQCVALVKRDHPAATAAEYSNVGLDWCNAVFDA